MKKIKIRHKGNPNAILDRILKRWPQLRGEPILGTDEFEKPKIFMEHDEETLVITLLDTSIPDSDIEAEATKFDETEESEGEKLEEETKKALQRLKQRARTNPIVRDFLILLKEIVQDE